MSNLSTSARSNDAPIYSRGDVFRLLDRATLALGLPASVYRTAQVLIRFIPADAPAPISPARVQELAEIIGVDPRTIRAHIRKLAALGLVSDQTLAGGHRVIRRRADTIIALHGIDFAPMLARRAALEAEAARIEHEQAERIRLRAEISTLRRRFRLLAETANAESVETARGLFVALPQRYAHLSLADLTAIRDRLEKLVTAVAPLADVEEIEAATPAARPKISDRSEESSRPNSSRDPDNSGVPLRAVSTALPRASRIELDRADECKVSASVFIGFAALGIPFAIWDPVATHLDTGGPRLAHYPLDPRGHHPAPIDIPSLESLLHAQSPTFSCLFDRTRASAVSKCGAGPE